MHSLFFFVRVANIRLSDQRERPVSINRRFNEHRSQILEKNSKRAINKEMRYLKIKKKIKCVIF